MDRDQYQRLKRVFATASELPEVERAAYLREACGSDGDLLREAERMLSLDSKPVESALDEVLSGDGGAGLRQPLAIPESIGSYRIVRVCGHGGMGTVYEARQDAPKRRVALKVIQIGALTEETLRRFHLEAEILGRLQHPGVAQVFEAGEFELNGLTLPFFAMEFVEGPNLLEYAARHKLATHARIELFLRVCDALEHAHQQGVVHRDLKPDNILVTDASASEGTAGLERGASMPIGHPKILDFGVARLLDADVRATLSTGAGQLLGSVPYMSPEQSHAQPDKIDARSDVYTLGVVLFELLTGRMPYAVTDRPLTEALVTVQEAEPLRLSSIVPALRGDLETIVGKCLEKEPARRYGSVGQLARDLRNQRSHQPIAARPPSTLYQIIKFSRRNRALVLGTIATVTALSIGLVLALRFGLRAQRNEARALRELYRSKITAAEALLEADPSAARRALSSIERDQHGWEWRYLDSRLSPQLLEFGAHVEGTPLSVVGEGRHVMAVSDERTMTLWNPYTGEAADSWVAPDVSTAWGVSSGGSRIAAATRSGDVYVTERDAKDWVLWVAADSPAERLVFSPDGSSLAVLQADQLLLGKPGHWLPLSYPKGIRPPELAFHPSGDRVALMTVPVLSPRIRLLDTTDLSQLALHEAVRGPRSLLFTSDGSKIVAGTAQRDVVTLDSTTLRPLHRWLGHADEVVHVDASEHGFLSSSIDGTIRAWTRDGSCTSVIPEPDVRSTLFLSPTRAVSASGGRLHLLDIGGDSRRVLRGHESYVYELAFSADGSLLASHAPFAPAEVLVWEAFTGSVVHRWSTPRVRGELGFSDRGQVAFGSDSILSTTPWYGADSATSAPPSLLAHRWSRPDHQLIATETSALWTRVDTPTVFRTEYDLAGEKPTRMFADGVVLPSERVGEPSPRDVGLHPRLFVGSYAGKPGENRGSITDLVVFGDHLSETDAAAVESYLDARRAGARLRLPSVSSAPLLAHFQANDSSVIATAKGQPTSDASSLRHVGAWVAENDSNLVLKAYGKTTNELLFAPAESGRPDRVEFQNQYLNHRWLETSFPAIRGRERLTVFFLGAYSGSVNRGISTVYSIGTAAYPLWDWAERDTRVRRVGVGESYSADGRLRARAWRGHPMNVLVTDAETSEPVFELEGDYSGLDLHPSGKLLACGRTDGRLEIWNLERRERTAEVAAHHGTVYAVAWAPDGARIVTGGNDNVARVWDAQSLDSLLELRGHAQYVKAVAFSPDGTMIATASGDNTVRIWDSVSAAARYARVLADLRVRQEIGAIVQQWITTLGSTESVADAIRVEWDADDPRRRAAFALLAERHSN